MAPAAAASARPARPLRGRVNGAPVVTLSITDGTPRTFTHCHEGQYGSAAATLRAGIRSGRPDQPGVDVAGPTQRADPVEQPLQAGPRRATGRRRSAWSPPASSCTGSRPAPAPSRSTSSSACQGGVVGRRQVLERQRAHRPGEPGQHVHLEALDVDLAEGRLPVPGDEVVEGGNLHLDGPVPAHPGEPVVGPDRVDPRRSTSTRRSASRVEMPSRARPAVAPTAPGTMTTPSVAPEQQPQHAQAVRLRLDRDDPGPQRAPGAHPAPDVSADVEAEVAGTEELPVEPGRPAAATGYAVVDGQGPAQAPGAREHSRMLTERAGPPGAGGRSGGQLGLQRGREADREPHLAEQLLAAPRPAAAARPGPRRRRRPGAAARSRRPGAGPSRRRSGPSTHSVGPPLPLRSNSSGTCAGSRWKPRCFQPMVDGSSPGSSAVDGPGGGDLVEVVGQQVAGPVGQLDLDRADVGQRPLRGGHRPAGPPLQVGAGARAERPQPAPGQLGRGAARVQVGGVEAAGQPRRRSPPTGTGR